MEDFEINDYNDNLYCLEKENKLIKHEMFHKYMIVWMRKNHLFSNYTYVEYDYKLHKYKSNIKKNEIHDIINKSKINIHEYENSKNIENIKKNKDLGVYLNKLISLNVKNI